MNYTIHAREMQEKSSVFLEKSRLFSALFRPGLVSCALFSKNSHVFVCKTSARCVIL
ncbi:hypothetical protein [Oscillospiraceae bacterium]|nr:hypothetical protein [Oscillospiraceae bacterium]